MCRSVRRVAAAARAPDVAGLGAVGVGCCVAHLFEGVAAVAEVLRPVGHQLELAGLHLGAVLGALEVAQLRAEPVDAAVEAAHLGVEGVDEAPQQALALVGELGAVRPHALGEDAERFAHRVDGVVCVPDVAGVELAALGGCAEELRVLADGCSSIESNYNAVIMIYSPLRVCLDHRVTHQFEPEVTAPCRYNPPRTEWLDRAALRETVGSSSA